MIIIWKFLIDDWMRKKEIQFNDEERDFIVPLLKQLIKSLKKDKDFLKKDILECNLILKKVESSYESIYKECEYLKIYDLVRAHFYF